MTQLDSTVLHSKVPFPNGFLIRRSLVQVQSGAPLLKVGIPAASPKKAGSEWTPLAFWSKVRCSYIESECWPWLGTKDKDGYGRFHEGKRHVRAHRRAYELTTGLTLSSGQSVLHSCDNPACCNPAHLSLGTHQDNMRDRGAKGRTAKGERNGRSKLNQAKAQEIRDWRKLGASFRSIGTRFGVNEKVIRDICSGRLWSLPLPKCEPRGEA